jgi:hypothetical protein
MSELQGADLFASELQALGYKPQRPTPDIVTFEYTIENGPRAGMVVELGFHVPGNFPIEPPHGPCYRPGFLRNRGMPGLHPGHTIGPEWDHWSRPCEAWAGTDRTVRAYMRHIRALSEDMPPADEEEADAA